MGVRWDWEWLDDRFAWQRGRDGLSRPLKLEEFLTLDFTAEMQIKTFSLNFRLFGPYSQISPMLSFLLKAN